MVDIGNYQFGLCQGDLLKWQPTFWSCCKWSTENYMFFFVDMETQKKMEEDNCKSDSHWNRTINLYNVADVIGWAPSCLSELLFIQSLPFMLQWAQAGLHMSGGQTRALCTALSSSHDDNAKVKIQGHTITLGQCLLNNMMYNLQFTFFLEF